MDGRLLVCKNTRKGHSKDSVSYKICLQFQFTADVVNNQITSNPFLGLCPESHLKLLEHGERFHLITVSCRFFFCKFQKNYFYKSLKKFCDVSFRARDPKSPETFYHRSYQQRLTASFRTACFRFSCFLNLALSLLTRSRWSLSENIIFRPSFLPYHVPHLSFIASMTSS